MIEIINMLFPWILDFLESIRRDVIDAITIITAIGGFSGFCFALKIAKKKSTEVKNKQDDVLKRIDKLEENIHYMLNQIDEDKIIYKRIAKHKRGSYHISGGKLHEIKYMLKRIRDKILVKTNLDLVFDTEQQKNSEKK